MQCLKIWIECLKQKNSMCTYVKPTKYQKVFEPCVIHFSDFLVCTVHLVHHRNPCLCLRVWSRICIGNKPVSIDPACCQFILWVCFRINRRNIDTHCEGGSECLATSVNTAVHPLFKRHCKIFSPSSKPCNIQFHPLPPTALRVSTLNTENADASICRL